MRDFLASKRFKVLLALLALLLGFIIAAAYSQGSSNFFSNAVNIITSPLQKLSATISDGTAEFFQKYTDSAAVYEENQQLQQEISELRRYITDYDTLKHENEQFRQIIGEMENRTDLTIKTSSVIGRDGSSRFYSFVIDSGSVDGVKYLDPVMDANGLVGYVAEVGITSSKVRTILDISVDVAAITSIDSITRDIGIVSGTVALAEKELCMMEYLPLDHAVTVGDYIYTSGGGGGVFPKDIYIGQVVEMAQNTDGTQPIAVIKPGATIATLKNVFVIIDFDGKIRVDE